MPPATAAIPADSAILIARITPIKRTELNAAPNIGIAYENAGTMRARMLTLEGIDCPVSTSGVGVIDRLLRLWTSSLRRRRRHIELRLIDRRVHFYLGEFSS